MNKYLIVFVLFALTTNYCTIGKSVQYNERLDLSSIMNLLPTGNNSLGGLNLHGMSLSDIMKLMKLIKQLKDLKDEVSAIPTDVLNSINSFIDVLNQNGFNLDQITQDNLGNNKRGIKINVL